MKNGRKKKGKVGKKREWREEKERRRGEVEKGGGEEWRGRREKPSCSLDVGARPLPAPVTALFNFSCFLSTRAKEAVMRLFILPKKHCDNKSLS